MSALLEYPVTIQPLSAEDGGGYLALVHDLPGCMSDGATPQEALSNIEDAIACWIEAARELGRPIPVPTYAEHAPLS
jgi:antitoxin HicB